MAGIFAFKFLSDGQLADVETDIYLVPAATTAILKKLIVVNSTAGAVTLSIFIKNGAGASRLVSDKDYSLPANESRVIDVNNIILETGDSIRGIAGAAASIDYSLSGVLET